VRGEDLDTSVMRYLQQKYVGNMLPRKNLEKLWLKVKEEYKTDYQKAREGSPVPLIVDLKYLRTGLYLRFLAGGVFSVISVAAFLDPALGLTTLPAVISGAIGLYGVVGAFQLYFYSQNPYTVPASSRPKRGG